MESFFDASSDYPFQLFSMSHLLALSGALIGFLCIMAMKKG